MTTASTEMEPACLDLDDATLLQRIARERSEEAFAIFHARHAAAARALAVRLTGDRAAAEDAVQESMLRVWRAAGKFRPGNARAWLLRILARECWRQRQRQRGGERRALHASQTREYAAAEVFDRDDLSSSLRSRVSSLPALERSLLNLHFKDGLSQRKISAVLAMPQQTISSRLKNALSQLRKSFTLQTV
jgi:RNA polymerase sigma-70 factor (ECF subfamily)